MGRELGVGGIDLGGVRGRSGHEYDQNTSHTCTKFSKA